MPQQQTQVDPGLIIRALNDEIDRLNLVLDHVPLEVRLKAEEAASQPACPRCSRPEVVGTPKE